MASERVLLVDDDYRLLAGLQRQLGERFDIATATCGKDAIEAVLSAKNSNSPFAVTVCDMRMPQMDGLETLKQIRAVAPDTVCMMLTGNADQQTAIDAINQGRIFRFYTKPCSAELLSEGLDAGIEYYRLVTGERELLEKTLTGSIKVLSDVISLNDPAAHSLVTRLRNWVRHLTLAFGMPHRWQLEVAASLLTIGEVAVPAELVAKHRRKENLTEQEQAILERVPEIGFKLISNIPRLHKVAEIVHLQDRGYDGSGFPHDGPTGADIPIDARLLKILKDLAVATEGRPLIIQDLANLTLQSDRYDPVLLGKVVTCLKGSLDQLSPAIMELPVAKLVAGQTVLSDVKLENGHKIIQAGTQLSEVHIQRLATLRKIFVFLEPIRVQGF